MKKIVYIIISVMLLSSCSKDFLVLAPKDLSSSSTFYKTESHFEFALNGTYQVLQSLTKDRSGWMLGEMRSDNTHYEYYAGNRGNGSAITLENIADFVDDENNTHTNNYYFNCFNGVARANTIIDRIETTSFSQEFKDRIVGEALFLRAFFYFDLVRYFGGVPLHVSEVKNYGEAFLPRASVDDVYKQIETDVTKAISLMKVPTFPQKGWATQGSARMLLAKVLMTKSTKDYAGAETHLREIMKMGYELVPNYADIYLPSKKNSKESLFEVQFMQGDLGLQSDFIYRFMPKTSNTTNITGIKSNILTTGGWNVPTQEMIDSYEAGDLRLNASVAVAVGSPDAAGMILPAAVLNIGDPKIATYPMYRYFIRKYLHPHVKELNTDDNWPVYRYADVLLMLSECLLKQNKPAEGLPYLNQVRTRAGLPAVTTLTMDVVMNERRHELAFETHRWFDLLRTDMAIPVMTEHGKRMKAMYPYIQARAYDVAKRLLYPIPYREMQLNKELVQNTGY
jgi:hypothetical protein